MQIRHINISWPQYLLHLSCLVIPIFPIEEITCLFWRPEPVSEPILWYTPTDVAAGLLRCIRLHKLSGRIPQSFWKSWRTRYSTTAPDAVQLSGLLTGGQPVSRVSSPANRDNSSTLAAELYSGASLRNSSASCCCDQTRLPRLGAVLGIATVTFFPRSVYSQKAFHSVGVSPYRASSLAAPQPLFAPDLHISLESAS